MALLLMIVVDSVPETAPVSKVVEPPEEEATLATVMRLTVEEVIVEEDTLATVMRLTVEEVIVVDSAMLRVTEVGGVLGAP